MFLWLGLQAIADMLGFSAGKKARAANLAQGAQVPTQNQPVSDTPQGFNIITFISQPIVWIVIIIIILIKTKKIKI